MELLTHVELVTGPDPAGTVIWMHGLGADGWDFVPIVREIPLPEGLALRFIFPHAPIRPVTINNGMAMRAWYDIAMSDIARLPDERGIRESQAAIEQLIAREASRGIAAGRVVLAGFSQGGAIALQAGLRHANPLAGIVALSTYRSTPRDRLRIAPRRFSWATAPRTRWFRCNWRNARAMRSSAAAMRWSGKAGPCPTRCARRKWIWSALSSPASWVARPAPRRSCSRDRSDCN